MFYNYFNKKSKKIIKISNIEKYVTDDFNAAITQKLNNSSFLDSEYYYAPYVPMTVTPTVDDYILREYKLSNNRIEKEAKEDKSFFDNLYSGPNFNIETTYIEAKNHKLKGIWTIETIELKTKLE